MRRYVGTALLLLCAAALIGVGLSLGQERQVMVKAINVCLECIGIG